MGKQVGAAVDGRDRKKKFDRELKHKLIIAQYGNITLITTSKYSFRGTSLRLRYHSRPETWVVW